MNQTIKKNIKSRFDGYLPVVLDVETTGTDSKKHALLEIAAMLLDFNGAGELTPQESFACHVEVFEGAVIDQEALEVNHIDPYHPFRFAIPEKQALTQLFSFVSDALKKYGCRRAILVGHNAHFDLGFIQAAGKRCKLSANPFHSFTVFDTATLAAVAYGKSVLAKALKVAGIKFDKNQAHSAIYDTEKTAELFCMIVNQFNK